MKDDLTQNCKSDSSGFIKISSVQWSYLYFFDQNAT